MAVKITLTGDTADLKQKLQALGVEFEELDDSTVALGKSAEKTGRQLEDAYGSDLDARIGSIEEATRRAAEATETLASHAGGMNEVAEAFGNTERVLLGVSDVLGVVSEQFGVNIGPAQEYAQAAADVAGGLEGIIGGGMALAEQLGPLAAKMGPVITSTWAHVTALYAQATAFIAANAPILIIIGSLALLAAGVVLAIKYWDEIVEKFPVLGKVAEDAKKGMESFRAWLTGPFVDGIQALWDKFDFVFSAIRFLVETQLKAWQIIFETAFGVIMELFQILIDLVQGDFSGAWENVKDLIKVVWDGIQEAINLAIDTILTVLRELGPKMLEALGNMGELLYEAGKDIIRGLIRGIGDMKDAALGAVGDVAGGMKDKAMGVLKINSPSLVFAEIGAGIMEGLEKGIFDEQKRPLNAMDKLAIGMRQAMDKLTTNEAGGGGPEAAMKRLKQALLDAGYSMEEVDKVAVPVMERLIDLTNEAGDGALSYEVALKAMFNTLNSLLATPAGDVVKAAVDPAKKDATSSANASGGSLLGIGNDTAAAPPSRVANQGSAAQTKAAKEEAEREATKRWQERMLSVLSELLTVVKQGQRPAFGTGAG